MSTDTEKNPLRNIGAAVARNHFTNIPVEFIVPPKAKVVVVNDLFTTEYQGGAELTTEAIIEKAPVEVFKIHSSSLTVDMLNKYKDKYWILGNFTNADTAALAWMFNPESGIKYSILEFDYKYCLFRSEVLHQNQVKKMCDCPLNPHGIMVEELYKGAEKIFWMSQAQKEHFCTRVPALLFAEEGKHVVQGSTFSDESLEALKTLAEASKKSMFRNMPIKIWGVQGSDNWIKGTQDTIKWCSENKMPVKVIKKMEYDKFLGELAKCTGFVFRPLDFDTCPRVVIEAKLLGLDLSLNENVQHVSEDWFAGKSSEEIFEYLSGRGKHFWSHINASI